ncbi:MAG: ABC transporter permease subunit [Thermoguttaceae bacterium]
MFVGPVFTREVTIAPRRPQTFIVRSAYGALLLLLVSTAWLVLTGTQLIQDTGDFARFACTLFLFLAPLQLVLTVFFSAMLAAGAVAQEKDRKTLLLLLLTRMTNSELVLGKLLASLLNVLVMIIISMPIFMLASLLGGVSYPQIIRVLLVTFFAALACGSLGSCVALSREKTFQALAVTVLILVLWFGLWEVVGLGILGEHFFGFSVKKLACAFSPWSAVITAARPAVDWIGSNSSPLEKIQNLIGPIQYFLAVCAAITVIINGIAIGMVRIWNPSRETRPGTIEEDTWVKEENEFEQLEELTQYGMPLTEIKQIEKSILTAETTITSEEKDHSILSAEPGRIRHCWDNPVLWREICTRAYGKKKWIIRLAYLLFFGVCVLALNSILKANISVSIDQLGGPLVPLFLLSLFLVNAQAVTSLTSERDGGTLDLLLVSDITPKEFVYGKIGGVFWNMKEMVLLPLCVCGYLYWTGIDPVPVSFLFLALLVFYAFVAIVGIHIGMQYTNTRSAVATSLGIIFFLFVGISTCMWIMVAFSGSFETQLQPFLAFMVGGSIGLYVTLGAKNPSKAIMLASFLLPVATFYSITSLLLGQYHLVFIAAVSAYGFTSAAMLIPAIDEFDVATGRTTAD